MVEFFKLLVANSEITPFDGKRNPFARAFEIAASISDYAKEKLMEGDYLMWKEECQRML